MNFSLTYFKLPLIWGLQLLEGQGLTVNKFRDGEKNGLSLFRRHYLTVITTRNFNVAISESPRAEMLLLIDNYDSFTYNLYHFLGELGATISVERNDQISVDAILEMNPERIVISPGPCDPSSAGICLELIERVAGKIPVLGVCLGHQSIGQAFGAKVVRAATPMHGKTSPIRHKGKSVFKDLPDPLTVTRYHSLTIEPDSMPDCLEVTAWTDDGVIMGLQHKELPIHGVQFHPESIASEKGHELLKNFLNV